MSLLKRLITTILFAAIAPTAQTQEPPALDFGPVLATAMEVAPGKLKDTTDRADTKNYVFRGRLIALNAARTVNLCFDTEHMRVAGAWVGKPVRFSADKNMGPPVEGSMIFATRPGPGWAHDGKWDDSRTGGEGPLPREWAHYRGLHVHGDRVVLAYTVGSCDILELPGCVEKGGLVAVTRTLKIGPSDVPLTLKLCEDATASDATVRDGVAELRVSKERLVAQAKGLPEGAVWKTTKDAVLLELRPLPRGGTFKLYVSRLPADDDLAEFSKLAKNDAIEDVDALTHGGPAHWAQTLDTKGTLASNGTGAYVVDDIGLPTPNPWGASIRFGGLDFFEDGRAALCTWDGDVWIVSGLDDKLDRVRWRRFAAGLQQPLGLKIIKGVIHTAGRDQITRLHDLNGDGEADYFENFNNDAGLTLQRHEFVMDLETDRAGNLYYCRSGHYIASKRGDNGVIFKLPPDGSKLERFATGFREPNGLAIGPDGTMTVADNEGNGIPQSPLYRLKPGAFYGFEPSTVVNDNGKNAKWKQTEKPIVWLPTTIDRSAGSQVWVPDKRWGPLEGQLLHTSYGHCALYQVLLDREAEPWQGAVRKFPLTFNSGIMRARFDPVDGQLYLCGLRGWSTNATRDGQFCRVRFTGKTTPVPVGLRVTKAGIVLTFSGPLDRKSAEDDQNWSGTWADPVGKGTAKAKAEEMPIDAVSLSPDGRVATVALTTVQPMSNYTLRYQVKTADGAAVTGELHGTIHRVGVSK